MTEATRPTPTEALSVCEEAARKIYVAQAIHTAVMNHPNRYMVVPTFDGEYHPTSRKNVPKDFKPSDFTRSYVEISPGILSLFEKEDREPVRSAAEEIGVAVDRVMDEAIRKVVGEGVTTDMCKVRDLSASASPDEIVVNVYGEKFNPYKCGNQFNSLTTMHYGGPDEGLFTTIIGRMTQEDGVKTPEFLILNHALSAHPNAPHPARQVAGFLSGTLLERSTTPVPSEKYLEIAQSIHELFAT